MNSELIKGPDIYFEGLEKKIMDPNARLIIINLPCRLENYSEEPLCLLSAMFEKAGVEEWAVSKMRPVSLKEAFGEQNDKTYLSRKEVIKAWNELEDEIFLLRHTEKKIALYVPNKAEISARTRTMRDLMIKVQLSGEIQLITSLQK